MHNTVMWCNNDDSFYDATPADDASLQGGPEKVSYRRMINESYEANRARFFAKFKCKRASKVGITYSVRA